MVSKIALDTNAIIYALDAGSPYYKSTRVFIKKCLDKNIKMLIAMQVIPECVNSLIHDKKVEAKKATAIVENLIHMLNIEVLYPRVGSISLFYEYSTKLKMTHRTYDILMSAVLVDRGVNLLCSYNIKDFHDIPYIQVDTPDKILKG